MVFTTITSLVRSRGPDEMWRKRKIFKLASVSVFIHSSTQSSLDFEKKNFSNLQHYFGRRRNVYTVAIKIVHRALAYATKARKLKKEDLREVIFEMDFPIGIPRLKKKILFSVARHQNQCWMYTFRY